MYPVVLFGATGYTGRLIAAKLVRAKIPFTAVGRDAEKLEKLVSSYKARVPFKVADAGSYDEVRQTLVRGTKVLINCAGPFGLFGETVVRAALDAKVNYLDITGEQSFMRDMHWRYNDQAKANKRLFVNSMAFEYSLGDFGAEVLARRIGQPLQTIEIFYYIPSFNASRGTKRSMMLAMDRPVYGFEGGKLVEIKAGTFRKNLSFKGQKRPLSALSFPGGEVFTVPQHMKLRTVREYMVMSISAARLLYGSSPDVLRAASKARAAEEADAGEGPTPAERKKNTFHIILEGTGVEGKADVCIVTGTDVYGLTSSIITFATRQILDGKHKGSGFRSPANAFDEGAFWNAVKRAGVKLEYRNTLFSS